MKSVFKHLASPLKPVAIGIAMVSLVSSNALANTQNNDLKQLENAINQGQQKANALKKTAAQIKAERAELSKQIKVAAKQIQTSEAHLSAGEKKIADLNIDLQKTQAEYNQQKDKLTKLLSALLRLQKDPPPALLTNPKDASDALRSAIILGKIVPEVKDQSDIIAHNLTNLTNIKAELNEQQAQLQSNTAALIKQRDYIEGLLQQKQALSSKTDAEIQAENEKMAALSLKAKNIRDLFDKIEKQKQLDAQRALEAEKRREELRQQSIREEQARLEAAQKAQNQTQVESIENNIAALKRPPKRDKHALKPFDSLKNSLPFPAQGNLVRNFGDKDRLGTVAKGINIATRPFAQITSPATGTIIYAKTFRNAGFLIIINVGKNHNILLSGLGQIAVEPNQFVEQGDPLGIMPKVAVNSDPNGNAPPILFVEFRKNGQSINPNPWWKTKIAAN